MIGDDKMLTDGNVVMSVGVYKLQKYMQVMISTRVIAREVYFKMTPVFLPASFQGGFLKNSWLVVKLRVAQWHLCDLHPH